LRKKMVKVLPVAKTLAKSVMTIGGWVLVWNHAEIKMIRNEEWHYFRKERFLTWISSYLLVLFFLTAGEAIRDGAFLLSEASLMRIGSSIACLHISWARVRDRHPKAEIGPSIL
jgi:hypothetical protein